VNRRPEEASRRRKRFVSSLPVWGAGKGYGTGLGWFRYGTKVASQQVPIYSPQLVNFGRRAELKKCKRIEVTKSQISFVFVKSGIAVDIMSRPLHVPLKARSVVDLPQAVIRKEGDSRINL